MSFLWGNTAQQPPDPKKFANISNDQVNSNQQAIPVKYLAGRNYVAGDYISPAYNPRTQPVKSAAGKGQSTTTGYKYFADFALVFCMGGRNPVDAVYRVIVDSDIRWTGGVTRDPSGAHPNKGIITIEHLGTFHLYWGTETQTIDNVLLTPRETNVGGGDPLDQTTWPPNEGSVQPGDPNPFSGHYDRHPAYRGQCYGVFIDWKLGRDRTAVPNILLELGRGCPAPWTSSGFAPSDARGVNPIAILYDWLTDTRFGMGVPDTNINMSTFAATYNTLEGLGARISPVITAQSDFRQVIAELLEYFDGWVRINGIQLEVGLWSHGAVLSSATLTDNDLLAEPELEPQGWGPTFNEVTVVYKDRQHHFNDYTQVHRDPNNFRITGSPRPETLSRPWITDAQVAKQYVRESGAIMALPFTQGVLTVKREWLTNNSMLPGKIFEFDSGFYNLSFLLRLTEIEYGADDAASAALSVEWERSRWPSLYVPPPFQGPGGFTIGPHGVFASRITEVPWMLGDHRFETQIVPLAVRQDTGTQSYRVWVSGDGGAVYQLVPDDASTSSFTVFGVMDIWVGDAGSAGGANFFSFYLYGVGLEEIITQTPMQQADDTLICFVGAEVISLGPIVAQGGGLYYAYALRARLGTSVPSSNYVAGMPMHFIYRSRLTLLDNAYFVPGSVVLFKLQPFTEYLDYDLRSINPITYTISGFADIPAPVFTPGGSVFAPPATVNLSTPPAGFVARYTANGSGVTATSSLWSGAVTLAGTTVLRARFYSQSGRQSMETIANFTASGGAANVAVPTWTFSGSLGHTAGTLTLIPSTAGSTIHYAQSGAGYLTGGAGANVVLTLDCTTLVDYVYFYASLAAATDSPVSLVDNRGSITCSPPAATYTGTLNHTTLSVTLTDTQGGASMFYQKNYGTTTAYTVPISLACTSTGDHLEYWATKSGLTDSPHVAIDNTAAAACSTPTMTYTGTIGHSTMLITLTIVTTGSTAVYSKNGGSATTYSSAVTLPVGQTFEWWATKAGLDDSAHGYVANEDIGGP